MVARGISQSKGAPRRPTNPLGQYYPVLRDVRGATGIFLTIKGKPPLVDVSSIPEHIGPQLQIAALGISGPILDLSGEIKALQETDPILQPLQHLAEGMDPHYHLCDKVLYRALPNGNRVVLPDPMEA